MSFNLGNWWEKLNLDILNGGSSTGGDSGDDDPDTGPDLTLPDDYHDPSWDDQDPYDLTEPGPEPVDNNPYDDFDPEVPLPGNGRAEPKWDETGPGFDLTWPFDWP